MNSENIINLENYLINKKYGIINKLINVDSLDGMPKIYRIKAHKENIYNVKYFQDNNNDGYGYNFSYIKAKQSAIGEAVERYCSSYIPSNLLIDTYNNIKRNANTIDPNLIIHKVSKYKKIDGNDKIAWIEAKDLLKNEIYYVPASIIFLPLKRNNRFPILRDQNSTGLATGTNLENALISGIYECIERDAFAIMWYNKLICETINIEQLDQKNISIIQEFNMLGLEIIIKQINYKIDIPVYMGIILNKRNKKLPKIYISTKAGNSFNITIYNLLGEIIGGYYSLIEHKFIYNLPIPKKIENIDSLEDHALFYGYGNVDLKSIEFLLDKSNVKKINNSETNMKIKNEVTLKEIIKQISNSRINIYYTDITTPDILEVGLRVVRVFSTDLCFLESNYKNYKNKRIKINDQNNELEHPFS